MFLPYYIKKEDIPGFLRNYKKIFLVINTIFLIVFLVYVLSFIPRLSGLYEDFDTTAPFYLRNQLIFFFIAVLPSPLTYIPILKAASQKDEIDKEIQKYKKGEMIRVTKVLKVKWLGAYLIGFVGWIMMLTLLLYFPIYNIASLV